MFMQNRVAALVLVGLAGCSQPPPRTAVMTVCDLSRDYAAYRDRVVTVRGVYFYGLRQQCPQTCATGPWPSFMDLVVSGAAGETFFAVLDKAQRTAAQEAKQGRRVEVWATVTGKLNAGAHRSPAGPCDPVANCCFGHLGTFPAQIVVEAFGDIQLVPKPNSPYDYSSIYNGAL